VKAKSPEMKALVGQFNLMAPIALSLRKKLYVAFETPQEDSYCNKEGRY
jgi:hypothetical protein